VTGQQITRVPYFSQVIIHYLDPALSTIRTRV
jgi:hypothetical protein